MRMPQFIVTIAGLAIVFILLSLGMTVFAAPNIPDQLSAGTAQSRAINGADKTATAYGSNVTQLTVVGLRVTRRWQGYYGNVSGIITLDDANNWTMYDWSLGATEGEIYAANASSVQWGTIRCINLSSTYRGHNCTGADEACLNITEIESAYGISSGDTDGVDETFNNTLGSIRVGTTTITNCPMVNLYTNDTTKSTYFWNETMLTYNNTETIIFTGVVNDNSWGFNNVTWDFQMIVGDNGLDDSATNYYFYVELT